MLQEKGRGRIGRQSYEPKRAVYIRESACVVGKKEGEGPLGEQFDMVSQDDMFGCETWEEAESTLQKEAISLALGKAGLKEGEIDLLLAGDLLGQSMASSFGVGEYHIPLLGLYSACATCGEALALGAYLLSCKGMNHVMCVTSSHFASAEKEFRYPLAYGNQRPPSSTWTVTGGAAFVLSAQGGRNLGKITGVTMGKIVDMGMKDSMNMGACMAPAAADVIATHFREFERSPMDYDKIITGDLGAVGRRALLDLLHTRAIDIETQYTDCGLEIYDAQKQGTQSGGSGCGCSAVTLSAYILKKIEQKIWKRILFVPTGALLSQTSFHEGKSIPGIAHAVVIESII